MDIDTRARRAGLPDASVGVTELYQAHAVGLIKLGVIMLSDRTAAEDVVQDAFFGLYRNWGRLSDPDNALAYARASVLNGGRAALRQRIRRERRLSAVADVAGAAVSFPDYYLTFNQPVSDETVPVGLELRSTLTGKTLATLQPPRGLSFAGITGAADDRTFVADAHRDPYGAFNSGGRSRTWYLVRVTGTGSRARLAMTRLPVPATPVGTEILAIALSPDGTMLAVGTAPWTADTTNARQALTVYSVATGAVLRTWTTPPGRASWALMSGGEGGADPNTGVAWAGNHSLAFAGAAETAGASPHELAVRVLDISRPGGDLLGSSRPTTLVPTGVPGGGQGTPFGCDPGWRVNVLITGDGTSFVCGGYGTSGARLPEALCKPGVAWNTVAFAGFPLTAGKVSFLSGYRTTCQGLAVAAYAVWVNATGSEVIGWMHVASSIPGRFGVFSNGSFRPLPIPVPGTSYQWDDGSLLDLVAW